MVQLFISSSDDDSACAEQLRAELQGRGYQVWQGVPHADRSAPAFAQAIERGIRGSSAVVVVWSARAAQSEWVERQIHFAQRLQKRLFPLVIDGTALPITLVNVQAVTSAPPCAEAATQLLRLLPPPADDDLLFTLLTHDYIRERKAGIEQAAGLLKRGERREEMLALLEDIARRDMIKSVRDTAQAVIDAHAQQGQTAPTRELRHVFGARCPNGHISYFDKRRECPAGGKVKRNLVHRAGAELDELLLKCAECGIDMIVPIDCEGYK